jgi:hypothetical protein
LRILFGCQILSTESLTHVLHIRSSNPS